jgi:ribosome-associated toxin RatA of RatAB toxin-antitoxin module
MRTTHLRIVLPVADAHAALSSIARFDRFPALAEDVRTVSTNDGAGGRDSDWEVNFRRGVMRWNEREVVDQDALRIEFEQTEGDFAEFSGSWQLTEVDGGCAVHFEVTYDFGIESLVGIMDPIAERVIKRVICSVLAALFGEITVVEGGRALTDLADQPA